MTEPQAVELCVKLKGLFPRMTDEQVRSAKRIIAPLNEAETWAEIFKYSEKFQDFNVANFVCAVRPNEAAAVRTHQRLLEEQQTRDRLMAEWKTIEKWASEMDDETWKSYLAAVRPKFSDEEWALFSTRDIRKTRPIIGAMWRVRESVTMEAR